MVQDTGTDTQQTEVVPPETYKLYDEESGEFTCPFCDGRVLRIADTGECLGECGSAFEREDSNSHWTVDEDSGGTLKEILGVDNGE